MAATKVVMKVRAVSAAGYQSRTYHRATREGMRRDADDQIFDRIFLPT